MAMTAKQTETDSQDNETFVTKRATVPALEAAPPVAAAAARAAAAALCRSAPWPANMILGRI